MPTPDIAGTVVNNDNQPDANLAINVVANTSPIAFHGGQQWNVITDATGHFTIPQAASTVQPYWSWDATASFAWFGGTVGQNLAVLSHSDPTHLVFRSEPGSPLNQWQYVSKCAELTSDDQGQSASSVSVDFTPVRLVDGSTGGSGTLTKSISDACDVGTYDVPAGEWQLSNATDDLGRPVWLSADGTTFSPSVDIGTNTHEGGFVYLGFDPPTGG